MPPAVLIFSTSFANAALPSGASQTLPPNIARTCASTASPIRCSTEYGTSGASRSAA